jgi:hypothetical protein
MKLNKKKGGETPWISPISSFVKATAATATAPTTLPSVSTGPAQPYSGGTIDPLSSVIMTLNTNPYLIGMLMILLNLGGRFLSLELTKKQEEFLQQRWLRPLLFFTVIFVATRNIAVAFWITLLFFFIVWVLANENSPFCLIPSWKTPSNSTDTSTTVYESNMNLIQSVMK